MSLACISSATGFAAETAMSVTAEAVGDVRIDVDRVQNRVGDLQRATSSHQVGWSGEKPVRRLDGGCSDGQVAHLPGHRGHGMSAA